MFLRKLWLRSKRYLRFAILAVVLVIPTVVLWLLFSGGYTAQVLAISVAAISAYFACLSAFANVIEAYEARRQREGQERPYLMAFFDGESSGLFCFVITNEGNSPALDITLEFDPSPIDFRGRPLDEVSLFSKPIDFMPPGKKFRQVIDIGHRFFKEGRETVFRVRLAYKAATGDVYEEDVAHNLEYLRETTLPKKTSEDYLKIVSESVQKQTSLLQRVTNAGALTVESREDKVARDNEDWARRKGDQSTITEDAKPLQRLRLLLLRGIDWVRDRIAGVG